MNKKENISIVIPDYALDVMRELWSAGEEVYIVGGCVRDAILGKAPNDYDMAVSCEPSRTLAILSRFKTIATGLAHGTVTAISKGKPIELTTFRIDGSYTDMRRPDSVSFTRSIGEDLARRDFTINAMAYSPRESLIDLFGGIEDAKAGIIRAVGEPAKRFEEDALRIMRAFRFSAQLGFDIHGGTLEAAEERKEGLSHIARERICAEFVRLICSPHPEKPLLQMKELGILPYVTGGYAPSDKIFELLPLMAAEDTARLGLFLAEADRQTAADVLSSLKCSNRQKSGALAISQSAYTVIKEQKDVTRLRSRIGEHATTAVKASVLLGINGSEAIALAENDSAPARIGDLAIGGKELTALGIRGKDIGDTLEYLLAQVIENPDLNERERLIKLAKKSIKQP